MLGAPLPPDDHFSYIVDHWGPTFRNKIPQTSFAWRGSYLTTPDKKTWTDNRISDFPDISDIVDFRHFYKSIWDQDQS